MYLPLHWVALVFETRSLTPQSHVSPLVRRQFLYLSDARPSCPGFECRNEMQFQAGSTYQPRKHSFKKTPEPPLPREPTVAAAVLASLFRSAPFFVDVGRLHLRRGHEEKKHLQTTADFSTTRGTHDVIQRLSMETFSAPLARARNLSSTTGRPSPTCDEWKKKTPRLFFQFLCC